MTHDEMNDLYELYILGALEPDQAADIDQHVSDKCAYCLQHLQEAVLVSAGMSGLADSQTPSSALRSRVLSSITGERRSRHWIFGLVGLSAACAALLVVALWSGSSVQRYRAQIADLQIQRDQLRSAVEILSKSETRTVQFGVAENKPHGRVFLNPQRGLVFVGSQLPVLAADRTFELWLIPGTGAPQPVSLFRSNAAGNFVTVNNTPVDTSRFHAVAVSVEPRGGSPAPTTTPILIVPVG